ncbi:MAG: Vitamin B12 dependent methionine synthase activation subunit [Clostridiales bacterium]|nr:Vitamin B12 dependent methionine synthase activation subunit [Clostridiales bacterium]
MIEVSNREIARYLGYHGIAPDPQVQRIIDQVQQELQRSVRPGCLYRMEPFSIDAEGRLHSGPITIRSLDLKKNLDGCTHVILIGATLGAAPDQLIRRYEATDMLKASIAQAVAAAMIEAYLDAEQGKLEQIYRKQGLYMRPRFSPGYGDLSLEVQSDMLAVLQMPKHLGVTLTDGLLMIPSKSITAFIGLAERPYHCDTLSCQLCGKENCLYRKE